MRLLFLLLVVLSLFGCATVPAPEEPPRAVVADYMKQVTVELRNSWGGLCSGVWVGKHVIQTAKHCTEGADWVHYYTPNIKISRTTSLLKEFDRDLALLTANNPPEHPIALSGGLPAPGDTVYAMGHPNGLEYSFSSGEVAAVRELDGELVIQTTAPISPGSSGGGLFDTRGHLLGIASFQVRPQFGQNLNFFVPIMFSGG